MMINKMGGIIKHPIRGNLMLSKAVRMRLWILNISDTFK